MSKDHRDYLSEPWGLASWRSVALWAAAALVVAAFIVLAAVIG